jgi:hypothetical protein
VGGARIGTATVHQARRRSTAVASFTPKPLPLRKILRPRGVLCAISGGAQSDCPNPIDPCEGGV